MTRCYHPQMMMVLQCLYPVFWTKGRNSCCLLDIPTQITGLKVNVSQPDAHRSKSWPASSPLSKSYSFTWITLPSSCIFKCFPWSFNQIASIPNIIPSLFQLFQVLNVYTDISNKLWPVLQVSFLSKSTHALLVELSSYAASLTKQWNSSAQLMH